MLVDKSMRSYDDGPWGGGQSDWVDHGQCERAGAAEIYGASVRTVDVGDTVSESNLRNTVIRS